MQANRDERATLKLGGYNMLKWIRNSETSTRCFPGEDQSAAKNKTSGAEPQTSSLTGMHWNIDKETLEVS